ncbi:hypothetical protein BAE44_0004100, partial [Dichanthelium oligosanthes]
LTLPLGHTLALPPPPGRRRGAWGEEEAAARAGKAEVARPACDASAIWR